MYCCRLFDRSAWDRSELRFHHCRNLPPNRGALLTLRRDWFHRPNQINRSILESACTCGQKRPAVRIAYFHCPVYNNIDTRELPTQTQRVAEGCVWVRGRRGCNYNVVLQVLHSRPFEGQSRVPLRGLAMSVHGWWRNLDAGTFTMLCEPRGRANGAAMETCQHLAVGLCRTAAQQMSVTIATLVSGCDLFAWIHNCAKKRGRWPARV